MRHISMHEEALRCDRTQKGVAFVDIYAAKPPLDSTQERVDEVISEE